MNGVNCGAASLGRSATRIDLGYSKADAGILDPTKFRHTSSRSQGPGLSRYPGDACPTGHLGYIKVRSRFLGFLVFLE